MSSIFDPGKSDRRAAASLAQQGVIKGFNFSGPGGLGGGFNFAGGRGSGNLSAGVFGPLIQQLLQSGSAGVDQVGGFKLPKELRELGANTIDTLGNVDLESRGAGKDLSGLGKIFSRATTTARQDPFKLGNEISARLAKLSERSNQRLVSNTFDRLKASGKLGTTGGANIAGELDANLADQALKFDLAGLDFGQRQIQDAISTAFGASGAREGIKGRLFNESLNREGVETQNALAQFGIGDQLFKDFLSGNQQTIDFGNFGLSATQGAAGLSQLPLMFLQAISGATGQASNSLFGAAGVNSQNAANARSPFLDAINAAGGFFSGLGDFRNSGAS